MVNPKVAQRHEHTICRLALARIDGYQAFDNSPFAWLERRRRCGEAPHRGVCLRQNEEGETALPNRGVATSLYAGTSMDATRAAKRANW